MSRTLKADSEAGPLPVPVRPILGTSQLQLLNACFRPALLDALLGKARLRTWTWLLWSDCSALWMETKLVCYINPLLCPSETLSDGRLFISAPCDLSDWHFIKLLWQRRERCRYLFGSFSFSVSYFSFCLFHTQTFVCVRSFCSSVCLRFMQIS